MIDNNMSQKFEYLPGFEKSEFDRLNIQSRFYESQTVNFLQECGLKNGMNVLDFGCGIGGSTLALAKIVGSSGKVTALERSEKYIEAAKEKIFNAGLENVEFILGDETNFLSNDQSFDICFGRLVLMYQDNPIKCLIELKSKVKKGGLMVFEETNLSDMGKSFPSSKIFEDCWKWAYLACKNSKIELNMGYKLTRLFETIGIDVKVNKIMGKVASSADIDAISIITGSINSLLPYILKHSLATEDEIQITTLYSRLKCEIENLNSVFVPAYHVGICGIV